MEWAPGARGSHVPTALQTTVRHYIVMITFPIVCLYERQCFIHRCAEETLIPLTQIANERVFFFCVSSLVSIQRKKIYFDFQRLLKMESKRSKYKHRFVYTSATSRFCCCSVLVYDRYVLCRWTVGCRERCEDVKNQHLGNGVQNMFSHFFIDTAAPRQLSGGRNCIRVQSSFLYQHR